MRNLLKRRPRDETKPTLRERLAATKAKAGAALRLRPDREADHGRRAVVVGSLAAVLPLPLPAEASPSDLAAACAWGAAHMTWINDPRHPDREWPDERTEAEIARVDAIVEWVADQPSQGVGDMAAKARLLLADYGCEISGAHAIPRARALCRLLREVGALDTQTRSPLL